MNDERDNGGVPYVPMDNARSTFAHYNHTRKCCKLETLTFDPDFQNVTFGSSPVARCWGPCQNQQLQKVNIRDVTHVGVVQRTAFCYGARGYIWCAFQVCVMLALLAAWITLCFEYCTIGAFDPVWDSTATMVCEFPYDKYLFIGSGSMCG